MNGDENSMFSMLTKFKASNFKNVGDLLRMFQRNFFSGGAKIYILKEKLRFSRPNKF